MNNDLIAEGRRLLDAATPEPWEAVEYCDRLGALVRPRNNRPQPPIADDLFRSDADFIVWARNNLPALLDRLEVALTKLTRVELALDSAHGDMVYVDDIQAAMDGAL